MKKTALKIGKTLAIIVYTLLYLLVYNIFPEFKNISEIFTGYCKEKGHDNLLRYYCKIHNKLCCGACLCKIKDKGDGQHKDCDVCNVEDIKEVKSQELKDNIILLIS